MTKIFSVQEVLNVDNCDCATINMYGYFFKEIPIDLEIPEGQDAYELKVINSLNDNCFGFVPSSSKNSETKRAKFFLISYQLTQFTRNLSLDLLRILKSSLKRLIIF